MCLIWWCGCIYYYVCNEKRCVKSKSWIEFPMYRMPSARSGVIWLRLIASGSLLLTRTGALRGGMLWLAKLLSNHCAVGSGEMCIWSIVLKQWGLYDWIASNPGLCKYWEKRVLDSDVCLSVCLHWRTLLPPDRCLLNLIFEILFVAKMCRENSNVVKIWPE
jgi:hypothetical protein